jgi:hypothetical protein
VIGGILPEFIEVAKADEESKGAIEFMVGEFMVHGSWFGRRGRLT